MNTLSSRQLFGVVLVSGILIPGLIKYTLAEQGADLLGSILWVIGFGTMIFLLWFGWLRPLNITGPGGTDETVWDSSEDRSEPGSDS